MTYGHTTSKCEKSKYEPRNTKKNAYICITESLCCTEEINTTLSINYTSIKLKKQKPNWTSVFKGTYNKKCQ